MKKTLTKIAKSYVISVLTESKDINALTPQAFAESQGMSLRKMQRTLAAERENYADIREAERLAIARKMLKKMSVAEVSSAIGYKSTSSFILAFKRWYGVTPGKIFKTVKQK